MKKKYVKPEAFFEKFKMSQQIAACTYDSNNTANDIGCAFTGVNEADFEVTVFLDTTAACTTKAESYCYHGSTGGMYSIFNS